MRIETRIGLVLNALGLTIGRFTLFANNVDSFLSGAFLGFGIFLLVAGLLPKETYDNLLYRKLLAKRNG